MDYGAKLAETYRNTEISTSNRLRLLIMLYEGAINFTKKASSSMSAGNYAVKGQCISKAMAIISELRNTLDFEAGGNIAKELERLYLYINDELVQANLKNQDEPLQNSLRVLEILHSAWSELEDNLAKEGLSGIEKIGRNDGHFIGINI